MEKIWYQLSKNVVVVVGGGVAVTRGAKRGLNARCCDGKCIFSALWGWMDGWDSSHCMFVFAAETGMAVSSMPQCWRVKKN